MMTLGEGGSLVPQQLGQYRLVEKLGEGGMGVVYRAQDEHGSRQVAVKLLRGEWAQDPRTVERFHREARITSALNHPHICAVYEFGDYNRCPYMVMELLSGQTLSDMLGGWPLTVDRLLDIGIQVADALAAAHGIGIIHRDIKSSNIFITEAGLAKVLDFGLAKLGGEAPIELVSALGPGSSLSMPGLTVGTATNMSPEQVAGKELDHRSDIFSLGTVLYEMATGVLPFRGIDSAMIMQAILCESYPLASKLNPNLPADIDNIIAKVLQKGRDLRYQTMAELRAELVALQRHLDLPRPPEDEAEAAAEPVAPSESMAPAEREGLEFVERGSGILYWFRVPLGGISYPIGFSRTLQPALENRLITQVRLILDSTEGATPALWNQQVLPLLHGWAKRKKRQIATMTQERRGRIYDPVLGNTLLTWIFVDLSVELIPSFKIFLSEDEDCRIGQSSEAEILLATTVCPIKTSDGSQQNRRLPGTVLRARAFADETVLGTLSRIARRWDSLFL